MQSLIRKLARELRGSLPFAVVNPNPKNLLGKLLSYKTVQDANNDGFTKTFSDTSFVGPEQSIKKGKSIVSNKGSKKSIIVDLDNPKYIWDFDAFNRYIQRTSWYSELGQPPKRGLFILDTSQSSIQWLNRDTDDLEVYMNIEGGANNILKLSSGSSITDFEFLDGKIFISINNSDGVIVIDLLNDETSSYATTGFYKANSNISNRNSGTNTNTLYVSTTNIVNDTVNCISCLRSSTIQEDFFGRPHHYWVAGTAGGLSVFVPNMNGVGSIYDSTITDSIDFVELGNDGTFLVQCFSSSKEVWFHYPSVDSIKSDSFTDNLNAAYDGTDSNKMPLTPGADSKSVGIYYDDDLVALYGTDEGLISHHIRNPIVASGSNFSNAKILTTSTYSTPYMLGKLMGSYILNNGNDTSGNNRNLVQASGYNLPDFTSTGGPLGPVATFDSSNSEMLEYVQSGAGELINTGYNRKFSISMYLNPSFPIDIQSYNLFTIWNDTPNSDRSIKTYFQRTDSSGGVSIGFQIDNGGLVDVSVLHLPLSTYENKWNHICFIYDDYNNRMEIWINGVLCASGSSAGSVNTSAATADLKFGVRCSDGTSNVDFYNGKLANLLITYEAMTEQEIKKEYRRMIDGLNGNILLSSNTVDNIKVDTDSGVGIITTGTTVHIMNMKTRLIQETKTLSSAANHVDMVSTNKGNSPHYVISGDNYIQVVSSDNDL